MISSILKTNKSDVAKGIFIDEIVHKKQKLVSNSQNMVLASAAPCGGGFLGARREHDKRKVFVDYYVIIYRGIAEYAGEVQIEAAAHKKTWLGWNKYKTRLRIEDINFSIVNGKGQTISVAGGSGKYSSDSYTYTYRTSLNDVNHIDRYFGPSDF